MILRKDPSPLAADVPEALVAFAAPPVSGGAPSHRSRAFVPSARGRVAAALGGRGAGGPCAVFGAADGPGLGLSGAERLRVGSGTRSSSGGHLV